MPLVGKAHCDAISGEGWPLREGDAYSRAPCLHVINIPVEWKRGYCEALSLYVSILYFHFDVIAIDHDFVTWNAILRWRPQNSAGFDVEIRTVPRTGDLGALNLAFRQRSATMRACVADGVISSLHIEEGYFLALDCEGSRFAGWHIVGLSYIEEFWHRA